MHPRARHLVVIGGGPAGLSAARAAASRGARVTLMEHRSEVGKRLLVTGGGRCNIANTATTEQMASAFGRAGRHMHPALEAFGLDGLRGLLRELGIGLASPDGFHLYPEPASGRGVRDALRKDAVRLGVDVRTGVRVAALRVEEGHCRGVRCDNGADFDADGVVLATGGAAMPTLGADGSGYTMARAVGHSVRGPFPALVPLVAAERWCHALAGVSLADVELRADTPALRRERWRGPVLFTHRGLSGPAALNASGAIAEALAQDAGGVTLRIDLAPERTTADWGSELASRRDHHGARMLPALLAGALPASVAATLAELSETDGQPCSRWTRERQEALVRLLTGLPLTLCGTEGFGAAMVTRGGVSLKEVDPRTLGSRILPGLSFAAEVLDLDGPCGGYNLLWVFSSGYLAGNSAAAER